jgi:hypothetical protein
MDTIVPSQIAAMTKETTERTRPALLLGRDSEERAALATPRISATTPRISPMGNSMIKRLQRHADNPNAHATVDEPELEPVPEAIRSVMNDVLQALLCLYFIVPHCTAFPLLVVVYFALCILTLMLYLMDENTQEGAGC